MTRWMHNAIGALCGGALFLVPSECDDMPLSAQEKALQFMLLEMASCEGGQVPPMTSASPPPAPLGPSSK